MSVGRPWAMVDGAAGPGMREPNSFYPTPPERFAALVPHVGDFPWYVWEPACGDGALVKASNSA
jgi:hypothetical protein